MFLRWGVVSTSLKTKAGGPPLVDCPRLFIQYIHSYPPYWRPFLHPQPEDAPCRGGRDPLNTVNIVTISYTVYFTFKIFVNKTKLYICIIIIFIALTGQGLRLLRLAAMSLLSHKLPSRIDVTTSTKDFYSAARQSCYEVLGNNVDGYKYCCLLGCGAMWYSAYLSKNVVLHSWLS
jgi:hypothetical protein